MVTLLWAEKFNLPQNDARLLSLTLREAAEQVFGLQAFAEFMAEREKEREAAAEEDEPYDGFGPPKAIMRNDEAARKIADTPHLTGDPEWDAVELAETDPSRPLLSERMGR